MRAPEFWAAPDSVWAHTLSPLSGVWTWGARRRQRRGRPWHCGIPVICVGSLVVGGSGKTPVSQTLAERLRGADIDAHVLSHGYRVRTGPPRRVNSVGDHFRTVGDEALLVSRSAPTWVSRDRPSGARAAVAAGAECLILDDGFQDPAIHKDLALVVLDGAFGLGNGRTLPAGPLRETPADGFARADAVVLVGDDSAGIRAEIPNALTCFRATLQPTPGMRSLGGLRVFAFAGIGRPSKFFRTLRDVGAEVVATRAFPDHYAYRTVDLERILRAAKAADAVAVTTAKDGVRLPAEYRNRVSVADVRLQFENESAVDDLLWGVVGPGG